jgi:hypothetical protein
LIALTERMSDQGVLPLVTAVIGAHASLRELGYRPVQLRVRPLGSLLALTCPHEVDDGEKCRTIQHLL